MHHKKRSLLRRTAILLLYAATSFFVLHVFMLKNGWFRDLPDTGFSFDRMIAYTSDRPFAYRVLMPALINAGALAVPAGFAHDHRNWLLEKSPLAPYAQTGLFRQEGIAVKVHIAFLYLYASLLIMLYAARFLTKKIYSFSALFSDCAPAAALLLLPLTFAWGGHIYDFPELMLSALCLVFIIKKKWLLYYPAFILAVLNKEVNVLIVAFFAAFCRDAMPKRELLRHMAAQIIIGSLLVLSVLLLFSQNPLFPGLDDYWKQNIRFWLNPSSYTLFWDAYHIGLPIFPRGSNVLLIVTACFLLFYKWGEKPVGVRRLFLYTALFNIPLFLYRGCADEIRALSLMFPGMYLLGIHSMGRLLHAAPASASPGS